MKKLLFIILFCFSSNALAGEVICGTYTSKNGSAYPTYTAAFDTVQIYVDGAFGDGYSDPLECAHNNDVAIYATHATKDRVWALWTNGTSCTAPAIRQGDGSCAVPTTDPAVCQAESGDQHTYAYPSSFSGTICSDSGCEVSLGAGMCGTTTCFFTGSTSATPCSPNNAETTESAPANGCVTNSNGDVLCDGDPKDTYNGNELPGGDLPDNSCEYLPDGTFLCDEPVGDTSAGTNVQELADDNNPDYPQDIHNDYSSLPPGTGVDTNGDGTTDAITQDTTGDGKTDNIINADGTDFLTDNSNGSVDTTPDSGVINDDGSPNYPEAQSGGEEDGFGEGTGECTDNPDTAEDECGDINKSGATTPYCDSAPTCEGDPLQCANLYQNWQILCASAPAEYHKESLDEFKNGIDDGKAFYDETTDSVDLGLFDPAGISGWGYSKSCPADIPIAIRATTFYIPVSNFCTLFDIMYIFVMLSATWISIRIFTRGVS